MKTLKQHINEKLYISKDTKKEEITWDSFIEALLKHNDGTLELDNDNIKIIVSPPDNLSNTVVGRLKGRQISEMCVYGNRNDGYRISIYISDDDFQSGLTINDIEDLRNVLGEKQIEQIYFMVL
jgi:hypothetical protein